MLRHLDEIGSDDADYPRLAILNAYRKHLRIYRRTHKNIVKIKLYDSEKKRIRDTLIGLVGNIIGDIEQIPIMMAKDMGIVNKNVIKDMIVNIIPGDIVTPFHTSNVLQLLFIACVSGLLVMVVGKLSPFSFMRKIIRFIPLPFSLSNSTACMPAEMVFCHDELGMDDKFAKFSIPLGMQINMDGTAYYVAVVSMVLAHTFKVDMNIQFLFSFYISLLIVDFSGMGLIAMPSIYKGFGMPNIAVTMVIGIEPVLDMFGTAQSVVGNITSAFLACRKENSIDESVYYRK